MILFRGRDELGQEIEMLNEALVILIRAHANPCYGQGWRSCEECKELYGDELVGKNIYWKSALLDADLIKVGSGFLNETERPGREGG